jgi:beta-1,4-N-acetylglucosaminyltransferase
MINIFVTVGTTEFDELIKFIDQNYGNQAELKIIAQVSISSSYNPVNINYFEFSNDIQSYIDNADVIITHAGAGSVYSMLEKGKKLIVVPNFSRFDLHQQELANYVERNNFGIACSSLKDLGFLIDSMAKRKFDLYVKEDFFGADLIRGLLK